MLNKASHMHAAQQSSYRRMLWSRRVWMREGGRGRWCRWHWTGSSNEVVKNFVFIFQLSHQHRHLQSRLLAGGEGVGLAVEIDESCCRRVSEERRGKKSLGAHDVDGELLMIRAAA